MSPKTTAAPSLTIEHVCKVADGFIPHARGCKKTPSDCRHCTTAMEFYSSLPLPVLAVVTAERPISR